MNESSVDATDVAHRYGYTSSDTALIELKLSPNPPFQDRPGACKLIETAVSRGDQTMLRAFRTAAPTDRGAPLDLLFDAFSSREPVSTSLENASGAQAE